MKVYELPSKFYTDGIDRHKKHRNTYLSPEGVLFDGDCHNGMATNLCIILKLIQPHYLNNILNLTAFDSTYENQEELLEILGWWKLTQNHATREWLWTGTTVPTTYQLARMGYSMKDFKRIYSYA